MSAGAVEVADLRHLEFEHSLTCEATSGCDALATVAVQPRCGLGGPDMLCAEHLERVREGVAQLAAAGGGIECAYCHAKSRNLEDLVKVVPL